MKSLWRLITKSQKAEANDRRRCENCGAVFILGPLYAAHENVFYHNTPDEKPATSRYCERCLATGRFWS
jgi:hypothetical protein